MWSSVLCAQAGIVKYDVPLYRQDGEFATVVEENAGNGKLVGCMGTAMAAMMEFHRFPEKYNWETDKAQVSYDAAKSVNTVFGENATGGSSAALIAVAQELSATFGYEKSVTYHFKASSGLTDEQWKQLVISELNNGRPVIYSAGYSTKPATRHAFIISGYDSDEDKFYCNFGWDESQNGWFDLYQIAPAILGSDRLTESPEMITGIQTSVEVANKISPLQLVAEKGGTGIYLSTDQVETGKAFSVSAGNFKNIGTRNFSGYVAPVVVDSKGDILEVAPMAHAVSLKANGLLEEKELRFEGWVVRHADKNYSIRLATALSQSENPGDWKLMNGVQDVTSSVPMHNSNEVKVTFHINDGIRLTQTRYPNAGKEIANGTTLTQKKGGALFFKADVSKNYSYVRVKRGNQDYTYLGTYPWQTSTATEKYYVLNGLSENLVIEAGQTATAAQQVSVKSVAGGLKKAIEDKQVELYTVTSLVVSGEINAADFFFMRDEMPNLAYLDMREATIMPLGSNPAHTIPAGAFYREIYNEDSYSLALQEVYLPNQTVAIGDNAFMYCGNLREIHIPKNVSKYGYNVFFSCRNLKDVYAYNPVPVFTNWCVWKNVGAKVPGGSKLYVPKVEQTFTYGDGSTVNSSLAAYQKKNNLPGKSLYSQNKWADHFGSNMEEKDLEAGNETGTYFVAATPYVRLFKDNGSIDASGADYTFAKNTDEGKILANITLPAKDGFRDVYDLKFVVVDDAGKEYAYWAGKNEAVEANVFKAHFGDTDNYTFALNNLAGPGGMFQGDYGKAELYLNKTYKVYRFTIPSELRENNKNLQVRTELYTDATGKEGYLNIFDGMEITVTGDAPLYGLFRRDGSQYLGNRSATPTVTLENATINWILADKGSLNVVLKGENRIMGGKTTNDMGQKYLLAFNNSCSLTFQGTGSLDLNSAGGDIVLYPDHKEQRLMADLNIRHGVRINGLDKVKYENIRLNYIRQFARATDGNSGWETLALPFQVSQVQTADGRELLWQTQEREGDFLLREFTNDGTFRSPAGKYMEAGKPYIVSVPGNSDLIGRDLVFCGPILKPEDKLPENVFNVEHDGGALRIHALTAPDQDENFGNAGTVRRENKPIFLLDLNGTSFVRSDAGTSVDGSVGKRTTTLRMADGREQTYYLPALNQFEAYFTPLTEEAAQAAVLTVQEDGEGLVMDTGGNSTDGGEEPENPDAGQDGGEGDGDHSGEDGNPDGGEDGDTDLPTSNAEVPEDTFRIYGQKGLLIIESTREREVVLSSMTGSYRRLRISAGTTRIELPRGIYLVDSAKVQVR